jgi:hypothetical protein
MLIHQIMQRKVPKYGSRVESSRLASQGRAEPSRAELSSARFQPYRRTRSMQPPRGCAPPQLRCNRWPNLWHGGPGPHVIHRARRFLGARKSHRRSRQYRAFSRPSQKAKEINFQNRCSDSRHPAHGPTKTLNTEVTGQSVAGAGVAVGVTIGGPAVTASTGAQEQRDDRESNSGPTCKLASSPKAGLGATVGTLD